VVVGLVLYAPTSVVAIVLAIITVLALHEYFTLGDAIGHRPYRLWTIFCALILIAQQRCVSPAFGSPGAHDASRVVPTVVPSVDSMMWLFALTSPITLFFLFVMGIAVLTLFTRRPLVESLPSAGISSSALLLVAFPLSFAVRLHGHSPQGPRLLLFALVITWAADTTAYFVGRAIGKHPLAPHLSPKKTWEGSIASMIGSLIVAYVFSFWIRVPLAHLLAMAVIGNVAGQMGDLVESAYKRSAGVKDSGGILPGHGGILDRIDALILCIPVIWYYLVLLHPPFVPFP
jgi:phosphatidate cytidylyltransferase